MYFRNLTLFRFAPINPAKLAHLSDHLEQHALRACGPLELSTRGWVSPYGRGETALTHSAHPYVLLCLGGEDKLLPNSVVNHALAQKLERLEQERGKPVGGRERRKLKDEVLTELMPQAMVRPRRMFGYLDTTHGWVVVDSASRKTAETFVSQLRIALGSFPCVGIDAEESPRAVLTEWMVNAQLPDGWALGDEALLRDPGDHGAIIRARRQDLDCDEMREHLAAGKQVCELSVVWRERLRFTLDENLTIRKFKLLDIATESIEDGNRETANAELDARFALMSHEVAELLADIANTFGAARPSNA